MTQNPHRGRFPEHGVSHHGRKTSFEPGQNALNMYKNPPFNELFTRIAERTGVSGGFYGENHPLGFLGELCPAGWRRTYCRQHPKNRSYSPKRRLYLACLALHTVPAIRFHEDPLFHWSTALGLSLRDFLGRGWTTDEANLHPLAYAAYLRAVADTEAWARGENLENMTCDPSRLEEHVEEHRQAAGFWSVILNLGESLPKDSLWRRPLRCARSERQFCMGPRETKVGPDTVHTFHPIEPT